MDNTAFDPGDSNTSPTDPLGHALDVDEPLITTQAEVDMEVPLAYATDEFTSGEAERIDLAADDNVLDEFVDLVNARDFDALADILAADAAAPFLDAVSRHEIADGLSDLILRYPTMILTRGELGTHPIVATWLFRQDQDTYGLAGYLTMLLDDSEEPAIERLEYVEELDDLEDLVVETPDPSEIPEWEALADRDQF